MMYPPSNFNEIFRILYAFLYIYPITCRKYEEFQPRNPHLTISCESTHLTMCTHITLVLITINSGVDVEEDIETMPKCLFCRKNIDFDWLTKMSLCFNNEQEMVGGTTGATAGRRFTDTLVPCDFDISPLPSDQRRRYRQSKVGSLLVSARLFVCQICYERLKKNRLDAAINARFLRDIVKHAGCNVCAV